MRRINYGSVCSGIEAASVAWESLGWRPSWFAEIEPFPAAVLAHRWPHVVNHGDMTRITDGILAGDIEAPDVLVGGTPCQAFSVAGLRGSLDDARGNLTLEFVRIFDAIDVVRKRAGLPPAAAVWENVPGVLNTHDNAFGCLLGALCGADGALQPAGGRWTDAGVVSDRRVVAWRILDAQYFGVPQRRRRVFVVAGAGSIDAAEILFERAGVQGDSAPGRDSRQKVAAFTESCFDGYRRSGGVAAAPCAQGGHTQGGSETLIVSGGIRRGSHWDCPDNPHPTLNQSSCGGIIGQSDQELFSQRGSGLVCMAHGQGGAEIRIDSAPTLTCNHEAPIVVNGRQGPCVSDTAFALGCQHNGTDNVVCINGNIINKSAASGGNGMGAIKDGTCYTLTATDRHAVTVGARVRRLTPLECERLQGFPDHHTRIPWRGKPAEDCPDGLRYRAIGNSMAVPVMRWIGERIQAVANIA